MVRTKHEPVTPTQEKVKGDTQKQFKGTCILEFFKYIRGRETCGVGCSYPKQSLSKR